MSMISRRAMIGGAVAAATAMGLTSTRPRLALAASPTSPPVVVDGLDCSLVSEKFLELMHQGGAHCVHLTVGAIAEDQTGTPGFGTVYEFADKHSDKMVIATSVRTVRQAAQDGKIA